jgi:hypothetical protein
MDLRAYAKAKEIYDTTPMEKRPKSKMMNLVSEIEMGIAKERIKKAQEES